MGYDIVNASDEGDEVLAVPPEELVKKNNYDLDSNSAHIFYPSTRSQG